MEGGPTPTQTRSSLKTHARFNDYNTWKHKLRENCYKRVREDRSRLLWKMRLSNSRSLNHKDFIESAFQDIVSDELNKFKHSSLNENLKISTFASEVNDVLWEYDDVHNAYQGECEEILLEMQRIFYEDLRAEPIKKEPESNIGTWADEEDEYLARAVYEHIHLNDEQVRKETWCPICKQGKLQENHRFIFCTLCELQLKKEDEVNLDLLRVRLEEANVEHLDRGCRVRPEFCIENRFDLTALYLVCQGCSTFEVVI